MRGSTTKVLAGLLLFCGGLKAGEGPFSVTYTDQMEEQGNLEIALRGVSGAPGVHDRFLGSALELEYGLTGWWTTEVYLDGQTTVGDSAVFSGWRLENRFRLTRRQHWINPVVYVEFEDINGADKSLLEVVGHDGAADLADGPNATTRVEKKREIEAKLLLGSYWRGWNFSENFIAEKNVVHAPFEFGYAVGAYRPLRLEASPGSCNLCAENFRAGVEAYGGLGDSWALQIRDTSHYVAPVVEWESANGVEVKFSAGFGVTESSVPFLLRVGMSYEIPQFGRRLRQSSGASR